MAFETGLEVLAIDCSLAPKYPFPFALNQCVEVYREFLKTYDLNKLDFLGDSVGSNLCIATALQAKAEGITVRRALALFPPLTSGNKGESYETNFDPRITYEASIQPAFSAYSKDKALPLFTVLNNDLRGLPPIFTQAGIRDALESDSKRLSTEVLRVLVLILNVLH